MIREGRDSKTSLPSRNFSEYDLQNNFQSPNCLDNSLAATVNAAANCSSVKPWTNDGSSLLTESGETDEPVRAVTRCLTSLAASGA